MKIKADKISAPKIHNKSILYYIVTEVKRV